MRDQPAHRDTRKVVQQRQHRIENRSANVLEVNIDAVRTGRFQSFAQLGLPVIETGVKSEFLLDEAAFLLTSISRQSLKASLRGLMRYWNKLARRALREEGRRLQRGTIQHRNHSGTGWPGRFPFWGSHVARRSLIDTRGEMTRGIVRGERYPWLRSLAIHSRM